MMMTTMKMRMTMMMTTMATCKIYPPFAIQDLKGPLVDSDFEDDDDGDFGRLGSEHVEKLHFGGGEEKGDDKSGKEEVVGWSIGRSQTRQKGRGLFGR